MLKASSVVVRVHHEMLTEPISKLESHGFLSAIADHLVTLADVLSWGKTDAGLFVEQIACLVRVEHVEVSHKIIALAAPGQKLVTYHIPLACAVRPVKDD